MSYQCCLNFVMIAFYVFKRCYYKFRIFQNDIAIINRVMHMTCANHTVHLIRMIKFSYFARHIGYQTINKIRRRCFKKQSPSFYQHALYNLLSHMQDFQQPVNQFQVYLNCYNILENALTRKSSRYRNLLYTCHGRRVVAKQVQV